jgi:hypothetical protein
VLIGYADIKEDGLPGTAILLSVNAMMGNTHSYRVYHNIDNYDNP